MSVRAAGVFAALCSLLVAQDADVAHFDADGDAIVQVKAYASGGGGRGFGVGWVRVDVQSLDDRSHELSIVVEPPSFMGCDQSVRRSLRVEAGAAARCFLPLAIPPTVGKLTVVIDGVRYEESMGFRRGRGHAVLFISDVAGTAATGASVLEALPRDDPGSAPSAHQVASSGLPEDWRLFTSFAAVIVDGRAALGEDAQRSLRTYAYCGGRVVVSTPRLLPTGALKTAAAELFGTRALGMGQVAAIAPFDADPARNRQALEGLRPLGQGLWPAPPAMFAAQPIPGLGGPPVTVFLLIILLFAVLAGPVNLIWLRRRRQPVLSVLTIPLLGVGTTALILAYGIFHDGFGTRGVVRSWTVLDQVAGESATVSARTLFAGLAPDTLQVEAGAVVLSGRAGLNDPDLPDRWHLDADKSLLDGGIVPSRMITPLLTAQFAAADARLVLRRAGDALEVSPDGLLRVEGRGVVRDLDGDYWAGVDGRFSQVQAAEGERLFATMQREEQLVASVDQAAARDPVWSVLPSWGAPGTFAVCVPSAPWVHEHGLQVEYDDRRHVVFGRLSREDFVE